MSSPRSARVTRAKSRPRNSAAAWTDLLRQRQNQLFGILNGVDYEEWNPTQRPISAASVFRRRGWRAKPSDKLALQKELGLPEAEDMPLFGTISRLAEQKGVDIQLGALEEMLSADMQFVLLGSGSPAYERGYHELARRFPVQGRRARRLRRRPGASHRGRVRFLPHAVAVRAMRPEPDV